MIKSNQISYFHRHNDVSAFPSRQWLKQMYLVLQLHEISGQHINTILHKERKINRLKIIITDGASIISHVEHNTYITKLYYNYYKHWKTEHSNLFYGQLEHYLKSFISMF